MNFIVINNLIQMFPVVYALMTKRTCAAYKLILQWLNRTYGYSPSIVLSDFETAFQRAVQEVLPEAETKGCAFHFVQVIFV